MIRTGLYLLAGALALGPVASVAAPRVAADIAPVQAIAARVMAGQGEPDLILPPGASPHAYALRPSDAGRLQAADIVVWVGPALTPWLAEPLDSLAGSARHITLQDLPGLTLLPVRVGGLFEADEDDHVEPGETSVDGHLWLDPQNAVAIAEALAAALGEADPEHGDAYAANAAAFATEMAGLSTEIEATLAPVQDRHFIVFHDAYQYFEHRFDVHASGSVALQEGAAPGAARVAQIRDLLRDQDITCAFAEPQFEPRLLTTLTEGTDVRTGTLDPLGAGLTPGAGLYPALLRGLAGNLAGCLGG